VHIVSFFKSDSASRAGQASQVERRRRKRRLNLLRDTRSLASIVPLADFGKFRAEYIIKLFAGCDVSRAVVHLSAYQPVTIFKTFLPAYFLWGIGVTPTCSSAVYGAP
jgi:hypothetical protein